MLDTQTKRNIDTARDVLVGKVPDPKAQVEQITTALIYKFMDDLDKESVQLGGEARFFTGDYAQYAWTQLIDTRLTGEGRLDLYVRAITSMDKNPSLPQLFRDIFKGAFLPYNDPQTLALFLKEINKFTYGHSEALGNAFEYLLSIMSSQGDAGQFRTPRHIIDFMVAVVDPKKNETILDPACGTAGFLISSFKHIRKHNSSNYQERQNHELADGETAVDALLLDEPLYSGDLLTPDERKRLMGNIQGYDISPDMVRLSLVNLYLHGFPGPRIAEYDTLTSEERWSETFDVILANPPFMSPKGGIRPHKRFQVQAKRSEVLFVDYILEHLAINGRAGIIVPEGIIFRNENAYKQLRKLMVEDGLYCVISLPAGVFNPYAGVKTSILFFDNPLAKQKDEILFIKIENDGFDLGAQRRKIDGNDLPEALRLIEAWQRGEKLECQLALWVEKEKIAQDGDFNLSGERYKDITILISKNWPVVDLSEVAEVTSGQSPRSEFYNEEGEGVPFYQGKTEFGTIYLGDPVKWTTEATRISEADDILISVRAPVGPVNLSNQRICIGRGLAAIRPTNIDRMFLFYILRSMEDRIKGSGGAVFDSINKGQIEQLKVPLPPLEVQRDIVEQIEVKQAAIDGARAVIDALEKERRYFGRELQGMEGVEWVELGEVCDFEYGYTDSAKDSGDVRFIRITDIDKNGRLNPNDFKFIDLTNESRKFLLKKDDILVARTGATYGKTMLFDKDFQAVFASYLIRIKFKADLIDPYFYWLFTRSENYWEQAEQLCSGGGQPQFNANAIKKVRMPLLPFDLQQSYINKAKSEEEIIYKNKQLIEVMDNKIEQVLESI